MVKYYNLASFMFVQSLVTIDITLRSTLSKKIKSVFSSTLMCFHTAGWKIHHMQRRQQDFSGQIIAMSHDLGPQKVAFWKGNLGW